MEKYIYIVILKTDENTREINWIFKKVISQSKSKCQLISEFQGEN